MLNKDIPMHYEKITLMVTNVNPIIVYDGEYCMLAKITN